MVKNRVFMFSLVFVFLCFFMFGAVSTVCAKSNSSNEIFEFLYSNYNVSESKFVVAYKIENLDIDSNYKFNIDVFLDGEKIEDDCDSEIVYNRNILYEKKACYVKTTEFGEYSFEATLINEFDVVVGDIFTKKQIINSGAQAGLNFIVEDGRTIVEIDVESEEKNQIVYSQIPKEVIEMLTEENRDELLVSNYEYEIIESDPLIAWNIEEPPVKINYTINKEISQENQKKFRVDINSQDSKAFEYLQYLIFLLIIVVVGFIVKSGIKKKKN